jgi:uncharacterized protein YidB (DUF937 family)
MGLMDILNGMQNGPGGRRQPTAPGQQQGMSPWMIALLGLLAYKAMHRSAPASVPQQAPPAGGTGGGLGGGLGDILGNIFGGNAGGRPGAMPQRMPGGASGVPGGSGGGLGDILGGLLGGAGAGTVLNGGLGQIINDLQRSGHGRAAQSWVSRGENEPVAPNDLRNALGGDAIEHISRETGMSQDELLDGLSQNLPELVDQLTPNGRLPTEEEAGRW